MAYDEQLAKRVRPLLARRSGFAEKKMFGGVGYLLNGNMCIAVWKEFLIVRVGPDGYAAALRRPFTKKFDVTGRAMTGWVMVDSEGLADDEELSEWVLRAVAFVRGLPKK
jgi:TfoX N-terminal domain